MAAKIVVYTTVPCPYCNRAKELLSKRGLEYEEISLAKDPDGRDELVRKTGRMSFPQVIVDDEVIGGYDEVVVADRAGRWKELAAAA
jgi:glutaredoxin 3